MMKRSIVSFCLAVAMATAASIGQAATVDGWWITTSGSGDWGGTGNWLDANYATGLGASAYFNYVPLTGPVTVKMVYKGAEHSYGVGKIYFQDLSTNNFSYTIAEGTTSASALQLIQNGIIWVATNQTATINAQISFQSSSVSAIAWNKTGEGTLVLGGAMNNGFTTTVVVASGTLVLNKRPGTNAITANLTIGDGIIGLTNDVVRLSAAEQIIDASVVTVASSGIFDLNGYSETIGGLRMNGGTLQTGLGTLTVTNGGTVFNASTLAVSVNPSNGACGRLAITGDLNLTNAFDSLVVSGSARLPPGGSYVITTYTGSRTGVFNSVTSGFTVDYSHAGEVRLAPILQTSSIFLR